MHCPEKKCSEQFCCTKRLLNLSAEVSINFLNSRPHVNSVTFRIEQQRNSFFLMCKEAIYSFNETRKSIQDVIRDVFCPKG